MQVTTKLTVILGPNSKTKPLCGLKVVNGKYTIVKFSKGDIMQLPLRLGDSIDIRLEEVK